MWLAEEIMPQDDKTREEWEGVSDIFVSVLLRLNYVSVGILVLQKASRSLWELLEFIWGLALSTESRFWQFRRNMSVGGYRSV